MRGPSRAEQHAAQREEMVVLALVPHAVVAVTAEMGNQPALTLDGALGQVRVLEPHGDRAQGGVVPCLPIGESLVVLSDQVRGLVRHVVHRARRRCVEYAGLSQERGRTDVVEDPDRLEIRGEKQPAGSEHVVAVRVTQVALPIGTQNLRAPLRTPGWGVAQRREGRELHGPLGEPEVLQFRPGAVMTFAAQAATAGWTRVLVGTPRIEPEGRAVVRAASPVDRQQRLYLGPRRQLLDHARVARSQVTGERREVRRRGDCVAPCRESF